MARISLARTIAAEPGRVFEVIANAERYSGAIPEIVEVEFLSDQRTGVGTRFRERRRAGRREAAVVMEITEWTPDAGLAFRSEAGGAAWETSFTLRPGADGHTNLSVTMHATPKTILAKLVAPLMTNVVGRAIGRDIDALEAHLATPAEGSCCD